MEGLVCTWVLAISLLATCYSTSGTPVAHKRMRGFNKKLRKFKMELHQSLEMTKESLRFELRQQVKQQLHEAMAEIRRDESEASARSRHVDSELERLKLEHLTMKRQLHRVVRTLRSVTQEKNTYREASKLEESMNSKCSTWPSPPIITTAATNSSMVFSLVQTHDMKRILVAKYGTVGIGQIPINGNKWSKSSYSESGSVMSFCYVHRLQRILVGTENPTRITSISLHGNDSRTLVEGVLARGMAVDEGRELVFMITVGSTSSISRMSTKGANYEVIRYTNNSYPQSIVLNEKDRFIYTGGRSWGLWKLSYDGKVRQRVPFQWPTALAIDPVNGVIYLNDGKTLKKMSISDEVISEVVSLSFLPMSLLYYNQTVYSGAMVGYIEKVRLGGNDIKSELIPLFSIYDGNLIICLIS